MAKHKSAPWINWPNREFAREASDLYETGMRCDAWRKFMHSETLKKLRRIKGHCVHFNRYSYFDCLIAEFGCSEAVLRRAIGKLVRTEFRSEAYRFQRADIYDARAWAKLPLSWFADGLESFKKNSYTDMMQSEVLAAKEVPLIWFGIKLPWAVTEDCLSLTHRLKDGGRFAEMTFRHPDMDPRFENRRWVADGMFARETTRSEMYEVLLSKVKTEAAKHLVAIV